MSDEITYWGQPFKLRSDDKSLERDLNFTIGDIYTKLSKLWNTTLTNLAVMNDAIAGAQMTIVDTPTTGTREAFPIGAIYLNATGVNPANELGYGTWVQVAQGKFLKGAT